MSSALLQGLSGLAMVLALIWAAAWLARRVAPPGSLPPALIRVLATQRVGVRERVVLVEVGDNWLVLGVSPGRVNSLYALPKGAVPVPEPGAHGFARLLARARGEE